MKNVWNWLKGVVLTLKKIWESRKPVIVSGFCALVDLYKPRLSRIIKENLDAIDGKEIAEKAITEIKGLLREKFGSLVIVILALSVLDGFKGKLADFIDNAKNKVSPDEIANQAGESIKAYIRAQI